MAVAFDTMTGPDGQVLGDIVSGSAHIGECASDWMPHPAFVTTHNSQWAISSNRAYALNAPRCLVPCGSRPATADYDMVGVFFVRSAAGFSARISGRIDFDAPEGSAPPPESPVTGTDTMYTAGYDADTQLWRLHKRVAGVETQLGTPWTEVLVAGDTRTAILRMRGNQIQVLVEGVVRISATDSSIAGAGRGGTMAMQAVTSTTGVHLESWSMVNAWEADAVLSDRFEGVAAANLTTHVSDSYHEWSKHPAHAGNLTFVAARGEGGSGVYLTSVYCSTADALYVAGVNPAPTDLDVDLVLIQRATTKSGVFQTLRTHPTNDTAYLVGYSTSGAFQIIKRVAGSNTVLDTFTPSVALADRMHYLLEIELRGTTTTTIVVKIDGVEQLNISDASSPLTSGGLGLYAPDTATTTARVHIDQITVREPEAPGADVVLWTGDFDTGDLSQYSTNTQNGIRQYISHEEPIGGARGLLGVRSRYESVELQQAIRRHSHGYAAKMEVRNGDTGGSQSRNRVMCRINEGRHQGWDEWSVYYGYSVYLPSPWAPIPDVNTLWATHHRSPIASPSDPGIEPFSLFIDEATSNLLFRIRGGWADTPGGSNYQSQRDWTIATPLVFDQFFDVVVFLRQSYDAGIGRMSFWYAPAGDAYVNVLPKLAIATTQKARSGYSEIGYYRELGNPAPQQVVIDEFRTGTTFAAVDPREYA